MICRCSSIVTGVDLGRQTRGIDAIWENRSDSSLVSRSSLESPPTDDIGRERADGE